MKTIPVRRSRNGALLTVNDVAKLKQLYEEGHSERHIAKLTGISLYGVKKALKHLGVKAQRSKFYGHDAATPRRCAEVASMMQNGFSRYATAAALGVSDSTIRRWIARGLVEGMGPNAERVEPWCVEPEAPARPTDEQWRSYLQQAYERRCRPLPSVEELISGRRRVA